VRVDVENVSNGFCDGGSLGAPEPLKRLKRPDARVGVWWKGCRKQLPKAPFSAALAQVQRLNKVRFRKFLTVSYMDVKFQPTLGIYIYT
jgi:hypothetical protein